MGVRGLLCLLLVVTSIWAKRDDVDHLNLKSIFRIPRDFSTANFDHFELLERNNFHDQGNTASNVVSKKAKNAHRRTFQPSFANAQVMLRIGGDDMRDCSRVSLQQRQFGHQNGGYPQQQLPITYNPYVPQTPVYPCQQTPAYSYPGYYYPAPVQNYGQPQYPGYNINNAQTCYGTNFPETSITYQGPENGSNFLEGITYTDHSEEDEDHAVEPIDAPKECENQSSEENPPMPQIPVSQGNTTTDIECRNENMVHRSDPLTTKVSYVEVNLADAEKSCLNKCHSEKDQSLQSDEACSPQKPAEKYADEAKQEEQIRVDSSDIICGTCNRDRDPSVPHGQRFSKDVDSLFDIAANNDDQKKTVPTAVESGGGLRYQQFAFPQHSYGFQDNSMFQNSNPYFESTSSIQTSYLSNAGSPQQSIMQHVCVGPAARVCEGKAPNQQVSVNQKVIQTLHPYQGSAESFSRNEQVVPLNSHYSLPISHHEVVYANDFQPAHTNTQNWPTSHPYQENSAPTFETEAEGQGSTQNGEVKEVIPSSYAEKEESSNVGYEQYKDNYELDSESQSNVVESNYGDDSESTIPESSPSDEHDIKKESDEPVAPSCSSDDQSKRQEVSADNPSDLEIDVIPAKNPSGDLNVQFIPAPNTRGEPEVHVISENNQPDEPKVEDSKLCHTHDEPKVEDIPERHQWDEPNDEDVSESHTHDSPDKNIVKDKFFRQKYTVESDPDWPSSAEEGVQHNQDDSEESSESSEENGGYDHNSAVYSSDNSKCHPDLSNDLVKLNEEESQVSKEKYSSRGSNAIRSFYKEPSSFGPFRIGNPSDSLDDHIKYVQPQRTILETCQLPYRQPFLEQKIVSHVSPVADSHKSPSSIYYLRQQPTGSRYVPQGKTHIYKISPRRESTPDLVSTNHYLKVKVPRRVCRCGYVPVDTVEKELSLIRDSPCVCTACRMFRGELEQLDCDF